ncbi:F0F1-type ATP synthase b subunit [Treponema primitia ZAS-2]|uniref:ATP synthase subunit b n=1 Tax=Treponema primitia (strain ATCC BAA-887 / DSM 12427 / ZAS-2) TaxID=545694 RepID=F5YRJ6_TREPZ|nr:ATP synthase F0 subunit B [Treponema primitia]AEF86567.1 F0F1-type ATP synthase b subunit [Treponema primitia ZAS-2]
MLDFSVTFIITILNILILFFILRKILFKPVTKFIEGRAQKIQDSLDQAEKERNLSKGLLQQYEDQLKRIEEEATEIIRTAKDTAQKEADRIIAEGKAQADLLLEKGRKQIVADQRAAMTVFSADAAAMVIGASSRLIRRELNSEDSRHQAALLLEELTETASKQGNT